MFLYLADPLILLQIQNYLGRELYQSLPNFQVYLEYLNNYFWKETASLFEKRVVNNKIALTFQLVTESH